ncbi:MAG: beta/gamma crystallin-related protein [Gloeotrichia echinulata GP01]
MTNINNQSQFLDKIAGLEDLDHENAAVCSGGKITLFDGPNLTGESVSFVADVKNLGNFDFNDKASSIRVFGGHSWQLFGNVHFRGANNIFGPGSYNLGALNNQVSSLKKLP